MLGWLILGLLVGLTVYSIVMTVSYLTQLVLERLLREAKRELVDRDLLSGMSSYLKAQIGTVGVRTVDIGLINSSGSKVAEMTVNYDDISSEVRSGMVVNV